MRCRLFALLAGLTLPLAIGCGGSGGGAPATANSGAPSGSVPGDPIARVVYDFFDAVRQGHTAEANQRLTPLALQRITELDMNVTPPGSPTARFQVGVVKTVENDHALVELTWTDVDADGQRYSEPILCELRVCDGQWRICGMAQDLGPGQPPMVMDFESLQGIAPQAPPAGQAMAGAAAAPPTASDEATPGKEIARDPFQQPVQR